MEVVDRPLAREPIPDRTDVGAVADELERQAALLTAVATGEPRIEPASPDHRPSPSAKKMPVNVKTLRSCRRGLHACGSEGERPARSGVDVRELISRRTGRGVSRCVSHRSPVT